MAAGLELEAHRDVSARHDGAVARADGLEPDAAAVLVVDLPEVDTLPAASGVELDGDVHEPEAQRPLPERPGSCGDFAIVRCGARHRCLRRQAPRLSAGAAARA